MKKQSGFTLIELVLVIVILGILAAVAVPKFVDLSGEAQVAATESMAGSLGSASVMNFAKEKATATAGDNVANCTDSSVLLEGGLPAGYAITAVDMSAMAEGASQVCALTGPNASSANFRAIRVDNAS